MYRKTVIILLLCFFGCSGSDLGAQGEIQKRVLLIFCDVTSSLDVGEITAGAHLAARIIQNATPPVSYRLVPILLSTEGVTAILDEDVPPLIGTARVSYRNALVALPALLEEKLKAQYVDVNQGPGKDPNRSCIINSIVRAAPFFRQNRKIAKELDLVIISDMIEECARSPYQQTIQLNRGDITKDIRIARGKVDLPSLAGVRVTLLTFSGSSANARVNGRPSPQQLEQFWKTVFSQAGLDPAKEEDRDRFYFGPDLPKWFRKPT